MLRRTVIASLVAFWIPASAFAAEAHPACDGPDNWAAAMTGVTLKNAGLTKKAGGFDELIVERLASEPIGNGLFRQVHKIAIRDGTRSLVAVTVNQASFAECSESPVQVYVVSHVCQGAAPACREVGP